jgi:Leucine-rich repeat (LRR) protein
MRHLLQIIFIFFSVCNFAQTHCPYFDTYIKNGDVELAKGNKANFEYAINQYSIAMAYCPDKSDIARVKIVKAFQSIEKIKQSALIADRKTQITINELKVEEKKLQEAYLLEQKTQAELKIAQVKSDSALQKAQKLVDAFYFYDGKYALAYGERNYENVFYFINKLGQEVERLGRWKQAEQFNSRGFAKVMFEYNTDSYLIDTLGNVYRAAFTLDEVTEETQALDLSESNIDTLQIDTVRMKNLKALIVNTGLTSISPEIGNLKSLIHLDLFDTQVGNIPDEIGDLNKLVHLNLSATRITRIPKEISYLQNLTHLDLSRNPITGIPKEIGYLRNLTHLNLSRTTIKNIPKEIGYLQNLTHLDLSYSQVSYVLPEISDLKNLTYLNLHGTIIALKPDVIETIEKLLPNCEVEY